jgi:hypothetical protein
LFVFLLGEKRRVKSNRIEERIARVGVIWVLLISPPPLYSAAIYDGTQRAGGDGKD